MRLLFRRSGTKKRMLGMLLAWCVVISQIVTICAAGAQKSTVQRAISIVFDNSGSMYTGDDNQRKAWCRATYAIEVFAAMMNEGDTLEIYPMSPIEVDGKTYTDGNPLVIEGGSDVSGIREIYTPYGGDTPIETITAAYQGVQKHGAAEQWLIVLTDGAIFYRDHEIIGGADQSEQEMALSTQDALSEMLSDYNQSVNVMYLGIGVVAAEPTITGGSFQSRAAKAADTGNVLSELTAMSNMIFGRDELPNAGQTLDFDLPMSKLIVFVQGSDVSNVTLENASGGESGTVLREYAPHYSEKGAGGGFQGAFGIDSQLQGVIVTYADCPAGSYNLSCSGSPTSIGVYYEPDVDLTATLVDASGEPVSEPVTAGTYYLRYGIVDGEGNVTDSALLGDTDFEITYIVNGEEQTVTATEAGEIPIEVAAGDTLDARCAATYLSGYRIEKTGIDFGWPEGGYRIEAPVAGDLQLSAAGGSDTYRLASLESDGVYTMTLTYEGEPLTGDALDAADLQVSLESANGDGNVQVTTERGSDGFTVRLGYGGSAEETVCGDYTLHAAATYQTEEGATAQSREAVLPFTLEEAGFDLELKLAAPQKYFAISRIADGKALRAELTKDGQPLTDEELAAVQLTAEGEGLSLLTDPLPGESAIAVRLDPDASYKAGIYKLTCTAALADELGRPVQASDTKKIELQPYPLWLRWLIILAVIALLTALILSYLNAKILPKQIQVRSGSTMFNVDGSRVTGNAKCEYTGKNRRSGGLSVTIPKCSTAPLAKGGFDLELAAVSPRKTKSAQRRAGIVSITAINGSAVHTMQVGNATYKKNNEGKFEKVGGRKTAQKSGKSNPVLFEIANNANCVISGETLDGVSFSCTCKLQFL